MEMAKRNVCDNELTDEQIASLVKLADEYNKGKRGIPIDKVFADLEKKYAGKISN